jgi:hypothetical protein
MDENYTILYSFTFCWQISVDAYVNIINIPNTILNHLFQSKGNTANANMSILMFVV